MARGPSLLEVSATTRCLGRRCWLLGGSCRCAQRFGPIRASRHDGVPQCRPPFSKCFSLFCEGCSAAKRGPLRPRFAPLAVRWVVYLTAHFRAHSSIPAAVTGTPDRDNTAIAAVDAGAQHGRKWPPEPTCRHAVRQGFRICVFENSDSSV
jgi:hypothetical protein